MIRLFLLRHGNTFEKDETAKQIGSATDLPLTKKGCSQAELFLSFLKNKKISPKKIYSGNLLRQRQTAEILSKGLQMDRIIEENALMEIDYGLWEGLSSEKIKKQWPDEYKAWTEKAKWPEGIFQGSFENHKKLLKIWMDKLLKDHIGDIVAVSSNGIMRLFYSFIENEWNQLMENAQMEKIKVKTGHFCEIHLDSDVKIKRWNNNPEKFFIK